LLTTKEYAMSDDHENEVEAKEQEFKMDAALNSVAMETLAGMSQMVKDNTDIPEAERLYVMLHAAEAITFNILMHIAENTGADPRELADKTKNNLYDAISAVEEESDEEKQHVH
jgi:hypothetical protein